MKSNLFFSIINERTLQPLFFLLFTVPSAPRALRTVLNKVDPPVVYVTWQRPRYTHGDLAGFKVSYSPRGSPDVLEQRLDGEQYHFTTHFLSKFLYNI